MVVYVVVGYDDGYGNSYVANVFRDKSAAEAYLEVVMLDQGCVEEHDVL